MQTIESNSIPPDAKADLEAVAAAAAAGRKVDPEVARRVRERSAKARESLLATEGVQDVAVQLVREARGALDEGQEQELTLAQRALLRKGQLRLTDPDSGTTYILVPEEEPLAALIVQ